MATELKREGTALGRIEELLGEDARALLDFNSPKISKDLLHLARPRLRRPRLGALRPQPAGACARSRSLFDHGRLARHRLPLDPAGRSGHRALGRRVVRAEPASTSTRRTSSSSPSRAAATPSPRPSACSASVARKYAHKIPFIVKINHNELLTYPNKFDQIMFGTVEQARDMGAVAVGATIYFGSDESTRQIVEVAEAFAHARTSWAWRPSSGATCATRSSRRKEGDMHTAADLTGQANHLGVTIQADIIKQKLPERNGGYNALNIESSYGKTNQKIYTELTSDNPIDLSATRWPTATWAAAA